MVWLLTYSIAKTTFYNLDHRWGFLSSPGISIIAVFIVTEGNKSTVVSSLVMTSYRDMWWANIFFLEPSSGTPVRWMLGQSWWEVLCHVQRILWWSCLVFSDGFGILQTLISDFLCSCYVRGIQLCNKWTLCLKWQCNTELVLVWVLLKTGLICWVFLEISCSWKTVDDSAYLTK